MPTYSIQDSETSESFEVNMKFSELEAYFLAHPHHKQIFTRFPGLGDPIRLGMRKPDNGFRDVLKTVQSHHKRNEINTW